MLLLFFIFFIQECDPDKNFGRKNVTKTRSLDDVSNSKDVIAGPEYTRLQKIIVGFFTLQSLLCRFKMKKNKKKTRLTHSGSIKIDKRDKLFKENVLSDAGWLFGVTQKETSCKNNLTLHRKSD